MVNTIILPQNYVALCEEEMEYTNGGGTFSIKIKSNSFIIGALAAVGSSLTISAAKGVILAAGVSIATAIELGTAGTGTMLAGLFVYYLGNVATVIAGFAVAYGINSLKGKKFEVVSGKAIPNATVSI
ncbi:MAG: hypothetical protein K6G26_03935 [Lachnospiraceae bacterium]|nr:hypothetical protein [Lachnospiraceae bacterium]